MALLWNTSSFARVSISKTYETSIVNMATAALAQHSYRIAKSWQCQDKCPDISTVKQGIPNDNTNAIPNNCTDQQGNQIYNGNYHIYINQVSISISNWDNSFTERGNLWKACYGGDCYESMGKVITACPPREFAICICLPCFSF